MLANSDWVGQERLFDYDLGMRAPSRRMHQLPDESMTIIGCIMTIVCLVGGGGLVVWRLDALGPTFGFAGLLAVFYLIATQCHGSHLKRLSAGRTGDPLCNFARAFDTRQVDTWIIRAVWDSLQFYVGSKSGPFPLLPEDQIFEDLCIDPEDLDDIITGVAERTGYSVDDCESNPVYGNVESVGDLVLFVNHQPRLRSLQAG